MIDILKQTTPDNIAKDIAKKVRMRRKEHKFTQTEMSARSGVPLATYKRFEQTGEISLKALLRISIALNCEEDFEQLFASKYYASIEDIINERN